MTYVPNRTPRPTHVPIIMLNPFKCSRDTFRLISLGKSSISNKSSDSRFVFITDALTLCKSRGNDFRSSTALLTNRSISLLTVGSALINRLATTFAAWFDWVATKILQSLMCRRVCRIISMIVDVLPVPCEWKEKMELYEISLTMCFFKLFSIQKNRFLWKKKRNEMSKLPYRGSENQKWKGTASTAQCTRHGKLLLFVQIFLMPIHFVAVQHQLFIFYLGVQLQFAGQRQFRWEQKRFIKLSLGIVDSRMFSLINRSTVDEFSGISFTRFPIFYEIRFEPQNESIFTDTFNETTIESTFTIRIANDFNFVT